MGIKGLASGTCVVCTELSIVVLKVAGWTETGGGGGGA